MHKEKFNISLAITIAGILFSIGGAWSLVQAKANDVDKVKVQAESTEQRVIKIEVNLDNIKENIMEQKVAVNEVKDDVKAILKAVLEKHR